MANFIDGLYSKLRNASRRSKSQVLFTLDSALTPLCLYLAYALRLDTFTPYVGQNSFWFVIGLHTVLGMMTLLIAKQHKVKLRTFEIHSIFQIGMNTLVLFFGIVFILYLFRFWAPRSVPVIFSILYFFATVGLRVLISILLNYYERRIKNAVPVAIYGTNDSAIQVLSALRASGSYQPVCFFEDGSFLHGATIANIKVESSSNLQRIVQQKKVQEIYISQSEVSDARQRELVNKASEIGVKCHFVPTLTSLLVEYNKDILQNSLSAEDFLGREKRDFFTTELASEYKDKCVVVTGAGGSIGSELSRQILNYNPKKLILLENSEIALYTLTSELLPLAQSREIEIVSKLGSVLDEKLLETVLREEKVQVLFHAAAYKHVPIVEQNIIEAAKNNVIGTYHAASAAGKLAIEKFVLVSTDKAVRPTNIMGGTKRLAELITLGCQKKYPNSVFSVVRFGNVLGSSGSVIPLFKKQISEGGPVTVTHPDITRYFMTIPEASRLVLTAGLFSDGADTFVLDMGEPVKIVDLAKRVIKLSGYSIKDQDNPDGNIAIDFVGLRPGEKLFEELIFQEEDMVETPHEKICRVKEKNISVEQAELIVEGIRSGTQTRDEEQVVQLIEEHVEGFCWNSKPN